ncbi:MAG: hypothetical protein DRH26_01030 [Deltaproteobacteria bacterium]|nr:MAG: hypothetical protein DRH26_01030 [Deltaproteobacteria bacterium]
MFLLVILGFPLTVEAKKVTLSWDPSPTPTVSGYTLMVSLSDQMLSPILSVNVGNTLTYQIVGLENGDNHWFCIEAYDAQGNNSVCSNIVHSPPVEPELEPLPELNFKFDIGVMQ